MGDQGLILKVGNLTKPAKVLIEKISDAIGGFAKPWQIVRVANAEAEASRIQAESQITVTDLHRRAFDRFLAEEARKQSNIEGITAQALPLLKAASTPEQIDDDWITNFFDKSRIVSDKDMQGLWSRILAGEANAPGGMSRKTVNLVADLDKEDAILFTKLCGFGWVIGDFQPLVFDVDATVYGQQGITFVALTHLQSMGLLRFDNVAGFKRGELPRDVATSYFERPLMLTFPSPAGNGLSIGKVILSRAGKQLASVCGPEPVEGFFEYVNERWLADSVITAT